MKTIVLSDEQYESLMMVFDAYEPEWDKDEYFDLVKHIQNTHIHLGSQTAPISEPKPEAKVEEKCGNCKYYHSYSGSCRKSPPVPRFDKSTGYTVTMVILVSPYEWCGEFKQKQKEGV